VSLAGSGRPKGNAVLSLLDPMLVMPRFGMTIDASHLLAVLSNPKFYAILFGSIILFRLVCAQYLVWAEEHDVRIKTEETIAQFGQRRAILDAGNPYPVCDKPDAITWKIKIHNEGAPATNVKMDLRNITPRPKSQFLSHDFPYPVVQAGRTMNSNECNIPRGGDAIFELTPVWPAAHNRGFLTTLNTRLADRNQILIEPDEKWEKMEYMVTADNAEALIVTLRMQIRNDEITFEIVA
jgi:hypothetical protein